MGREFSWDFVQLFFGFLDVALFACVYSFLGFPSITGGIDLVTLGVIALVAIYALITVATIARWIRERRRFAVDWRYLFSSSALLGRSGSDTPYFVVYVSQAALIASVWYGLFVGSSFICYVAMIIFMSISVFAFSLHV